MKLRLHDDLSCSSNSVKPTGVDEEDGADDDDDEDDDEDDEEDDGVDDKNEEKEDVEHEDEDTVIFKKNCTMYIQENESWQELAVGDLCITCPNNNGDGGARIIMTTDSGDFVVEDTLTRHSTMKKECYAATWTSPKSELVVATSYQVVFSSSSDLDEFETAFSKASAYCI
ncbi:putative E3 SUMO-protein ligase RanBP2-like [Homarus americanus]|uniref:Putative E3 SUMO-protein ligase RanBP2-like n=1 Tax=Homarus americanus TaxID=6706 RepID=A0A8J5JFB8_HOMAM|nr:putative E3 SUMO-protein ligase RanBP2-like [Homarus americanus]